MSAVKMQSYRDLFLSRLDVLSAVLDMAAGHFKEEQDNILGYRLIEDMLPFGTQIAYTCNQPRNFALWCQGKGMDNLSPEVGTVAQARDIINETKGLLVKAELDDSKLQEIKRVDLADGQYLALSGPEYVEDFLLPNLYFHLVAAYSIMRMKGVPLSKVNYMQYLVPKLQA
ncbi:DUF1993 family protein [Gallaecimonas xiamenensis]|uniref:DUF1993 domain-containing protein n=1 Tax=Gallaecimonas xiamenensis 3-C-1 TaxID=745411 RepID=K2KKA6_9GAMM|nr:DUF1993 family protein [Gallaecimonas xiamenensis]EKE77815.1 hypothetical protein B3C1_00105 [Gallaecimonas xiamenensis 3-C-1]